MELSGQICERMIVIRGDFMDIYIFLGIYWVLIIIWSLKNKEKAKKELLQLKKNWKTGVLILLLVLFPFLVMASMIVVL